MAVIVAKKQLKSSQADQLYTIILMINGQTM